MSFQPGEIAKVLLVIAFAGYLVLHRDALALAGRRFLFVDLPRGRDLGPILAMWLVSLGILVFQRDLGSSLLFFGLFLVMLYVATERPGWLVVGGALFAVGAYVGYLALGHVQLRVQAWLDPFDPDASAFQIVQGLYGLAWGGLVGRGLGQGNPEITPYSYSDFILPSIGEELGLTGVMAIILLYGILVERGLRTALICRDNFGKLMAAGLAIVFALQVFVVLGGVTKLIPLTGLTTPFLSYGGSSLVANWAIIALLLRISDQARRPPPELVEPDEGYDADATQVVRIRDEQAHPQPGRRLHAAVRGAAGQRHLRAVLAGRRPHLAEQAPRQQARARRGVLPRARRHPGARQGRGGEQQVRRRVQVPARLPAARAVRPPHRLLLPRLRARRRRGDPELHPVRQRLRLFFVNRVIDLVDNESPKGGSVTLTIDPDAQKAAFDGLNDLGDNVRGAVVAIEPRTGKILAMVSSPSYNPNRLASHDFNAVGKAKQRLEEDKLSPLNNRAIEEVLPPGSTFKLVTAAAALDSGKFNPDTHGARAARRSTCRRPSTDLVNESGGGCGGDKITLTRALEVSCNVSFGDVGMKVGDDALRDTAEKFGFGTAHLQRPRRRPHPAGDEPLPRGPRRAPDRAVGDRPVRRRRHPAADGHGRRRHRQRRRGDEALPRRRDQVAQARRRSTRPTPSRCRTSRRSAPRPRAT